MKESSWLKLKFGNDTVIFGAIYRKGTSNAINESLLRTVLEKVSNKYSNIVICGDFNYPKINWDSGSIEAGPYSKEMRFYDSIMDNYLIQHQKKITRVRGKDKPSCIDLVITDDKQTQVESSIKVLCPLGLSDHAVLTWDYQQLTPKILYQKGKDLTLTKVITVR